MIWDERPSFLINLGDLTDGGMEPHRYEWTHEYFSGMGALLGRLPVFPVPGNGEGDLYWYRHYHRLPEPEGFYQFKYGDTDVQQLIPLYEQFGVDVAMFGHLHLYERSFPIKSGKVDLERRNRSFACGRGRRQLGRLWAHSGMV